MAVLAGFVNRLFALPGKLGEMEIISISKPVASTLTMLGNWAFFIVVGVFAVWVIGKFFGNMKVLRGEV